MTRSSFASRAHMDEMMDDFSITDERLTRALDNLRMVNRWLGGYAATMAALGPWLRTQRGRTVRVLDLGTGGGDVPEYLVRWSAQCGLDVEVTGLDANPATVDYARTTLDQRLPARLRECVRIDVGDALALPCDDDAFDVVVTAMFMHHLGTEEAVTLLRTMQRIGRHGLIVNDLHRHPLAYYGIRVIAALLPVSPMFRHDGPRSVLRGFRRDELHHLAGAAGVTDYRIRWHWAFRWVLTTL